MSVDGSFAVFLLLFISSTCGKCVRTGGREIQMVMQRRRERERDNQRFIFCNVKFETDLDSVIDLNT